MSAPGTVGAEAARAALRAGRAVVVPNPAPLTCVVAATLPHRVNEAKGRPSGQPVALWAHADPMLDALDAVTDLSPASAALARRLLRAERVTLLVPLRADRPRPSWLAPASRDGWAMLFGARWSPVLPVLDPFPLLYVSSANPTGFPPAPSPAAAVALFPPGTAVLDVAPAAPDTGPRAATTTLRLHPDGRLDLHREGAQDAGFPDRGAYLDHLRRLHADEGAAARRP